jgi:penicillin-binding protein
VKYITYNGVNYLPHPETPEDLLREAVMVKREKPIDVLMEEIRAALDKVDPKNRKSMEYYLPADAAESAPGRIDPRVDDGMPPPAPGQVSAETIGADVHITFAPVSAEDVAGYRLYRSKDGVRFEKVEQSILAGEPTKFINANAAGVAYSYYVTAVDVSGKESAPSGVVRVDGYMEEQYPVIPPDNGMYPGNDTPGDILNPDRMSAPTAPKGLSIQPTDLGVVLTWQQNPAEEGVTVYRIWFSTSDHGQYTLLGTSETNRFEYISPLSSGWYRVTAMNAAGESPYSASVRASAE